MGNNSRGVSTTIFLAGIFAAILISVLLSTLITTQFAVGPQGNGFPETGKIWVPANAFVPRDNDQFFDRQANGLWNKGGVDQQFVAYIQLPHGATVTEVGFNFIDDVESYFSLDLHRIPPSPTSVSSMAAVESDGLSGENSYSTTAISYSLIDNNMYSYGLNLIAPPHIDFVDNEARFLSAWISYEYT